MTKQNRHRHVTDFELAELYTIENRLPLLEHIANCSICSERLAKSLSEQDILPAPHYLKQKILAKKQYQKQKKKEFTAYCVKIGLAVAASLAVILLSDTTESFSSLNLREQKTEMASIKFSAKTKKNLSQEIYDGTDIINKKIITFTDNLVHIT